MDTEIEVLRTESNGVVLETTPPLALSRDVFSPVEHEARIQSHAARIGAELTSVVYNVPPLPEGQKRQSQDNLKGLLPGQRRFSTLIVVNCCKCGKTLLSPKERTTRQRAIGMKCYKHLPPLPAGKVKAVLVPGYKECTFFVCANCVEKTEEKAA